MKPDHQLTFLTLVAAAIFTAIAVFTPRATPWLRKRHIRPPHPAVSIIFRLWFAALAVASVVVLAMQRPHP